MIRPLKLIPSQICLQPPALMDDFLFSYVRNKRGIVLLCIDTPWLDARCTTRRWGIAMRDLTPVVQYLISAMEQRGVMQTQRIYREFKVVCDKHGHKLPPKWEDEVRQTLQAHCPSRPRWNRKDDFFVYHRPSYWSCKVTSPPIEEL
jgi:hypothetical protein